MTRETSQTDEVRAQLILGGASTAERAPESGHRVCNHAADQVLLSREVVMQRRDIHANARSDLAGP